MGCAPDLVVSDECGEIFQTAQVKALANGLSNVIQKGFGLERREMCRKAVAPYSTQRAAEGISRALQR